MTVCVSGRVNINTRSYFHLPTVFFIYVALSVHDKQHCKVLGRQYSSFKCILHVCTCAFHCARLVVARAWLP